MSKRIQFLMVTTLAAAMMLGCGNTDKAKDEIKETAPVTSEVAAENEEEVDTADAQTTEVSEEQGQEEEITSEVVSEADQTTQAPTGSEAVLPRPAVSGEELVTKAYGADDPYYAFKVAYTDDYLQKVKMMYSLLGDEYAPTIDDDAEIYVRENRGQLEYVRKVTDYDNRYQYIYQINNYLGFEDDSSDLYAWQKIDLKLCDEDKDGKIALNDTSSTILKTFYPEIDLNAVQEKLDLAVAAEQAGKYESIKIETGDKYFGWIWFHSYTSKDGYIEIDITLDHHSDYTK